MHLKRTATFAVAGAALVAWFAAAATSGTHPVAVVPERTVPADASIADLSAQVSRLHERLVPSATPIQPARDLFRFRAPKPKPAPAAPSPAVALAAAAAPAAVRPAIKLDGIAEDGKGDRLVRTAIISTGGQLFLAREGDAVGPRYTVARIGPDVVELLDHVDNTTLRLALR